MLSINSGIQRGDKKLRGKLKKHSDGSVIEFNTFKIN
jgi:hypothetical protein